MTYIENVFLCMASPLLIAALCMGKRQRKFFPVSYTHLIIGLSSLERQMIACAVRFNNSAFVYYDELYSMGIAIDRESYIKVAKMTAILRLANAMDRSHYQKVKGIKAVLKDRELQMIVDSAQDISLELGLLKDKEAFFEEVFGIRLVLRRKGRA